MTTEKRREWSAEQLAAAFDEMCLSGPTYGDLARYVLDARADLAEALQERDMVQSELEAQIRVQNIATAEAYKLACEQVATQARLEGAIEALEFCIESYNHSPTTGYDFEAKLKRLRAELEKLP